MLCYCMPLYALDQYASVVGLHQARGAVAVLLHEAHEVGELASRRANVKGLTFSIVAAARFFCAPV